MSKGEPPIRPAEQVVFATNPGHGAETPFLILGVPIAAWKYMQHGRTHTFDLTKAGINLKLVMFGGKDRKQVMSQLKGAMQKESCGRSIQFFDLTDLDFAIPAVVDGETATKAKVTEDKS